MPVNSDAIRYNKLNLAKQLKVCPTCSVEHPMKPDQVFCSVRCSNARRWTHRMRHSPEYSSWHGIKGRCLNPNDRAYDKYGGRGINLCERWHSFENFFADMGPRPSPDHSVDRIDNDGDYCPENCRWATRTQQARNRRTSRYLEFSGKRMTVAEWAEHIGISRMTLMDRLRNGWPVHVALTKPVNPNLRRF